MSAEEDARAAKLFLAAVGFAEIKKQCGFRDVRSTRAAVLRGLEAGLDGETAEIQRMAELQRLDAIYHPQFVKALKGDSVAAEKCLRIGEAKQRLLGEPERASGVLAAFDKAVSALRLRDEDGALVASGRAIAQQIDFGVTHLLGADVTKALYLVPQLVNVLKELGATPAARDEVTSGVPQRGEVHDELEAFRRAHSKVG